MQELIKIESREGIETVNARELHEFLGSGREFATWIKDRIEKYGFVENSDFTIDKFVNGKATQIDYHISIDMAKELSMVENNEKGKEARRYFIEKEKQLKNIKINIAEALNGVLDRLDRIEKKINIKALMEKSFEKDMIIIDESENTIIVKWHGEKYAATNHLRVYWEVCYYRDGGNLSLIKGGLYSKYKALEWIKRNL